MSDQVMWTLSPAEYDATVKKVETINARAVKRGFTGRVTVAGTAREVTEKDDTGFERVRVVFDTTVTGEAPAYGGWVFLAAVDALDTAGGDAFVLRAAPGADVTAIDRSTLQAGRCEHCRTVRANRKYTYLVQEQTTGVVRQVGSTCVKDFTGWEGKPVFLAEDAVREGVEEVLGGFSSAAEFTPATIVAVAWAVSRKYGWVPASTGRSDTTRELVSAYLHGTSRADSELRADVADEMAGAAVMAEKIVAALLDGLTDDGGYGSNLRACLSAGHVEARHVGIVVSTVAAYERLTGEQARRQAQAVERARQREALMYAGTVGEKITLSGTITRLVPIESDYGYRPRTSMLVIVETETSVAKMFTSAAWAWDVEQGDEVMVTGTVRAHEEYDGVRQTVLVRPKLAA